MLASLCGRNWRLKLRNVRDEEFAYIAQVTTLKSLCLHASKLVEMSDLVQLMNLHDLTIAHASKFSDASLQTICRLPRLEELTLVECGDYTISQECVFHHFVPFVSNLKHLNLECCRWVTDDVLARFSSQKLETLSDMDRIHHWSLPSASLPPSFAKVELVTVHGADRSGIH